jgi:hypothetical protein
MTIYKLISELVKYAETHPLGGHAEVLVQYKDNDLREIETFDDEDGKIVTLDA